VANGNWARRQSREERGQQEVPEISKHGSSKPHFGKRNLRLSGRLVMRERMAVRKEHAK
jgi:hypothetical protein